MFFSVKVFFQFIIILVTIADSSYSEDFQLIVLHTNDIHARFEQANERGGVCDKGKTGFGGYARLVSKIEEIRKKYPNVILLDGGDQFQGTLWFYVHQGSAASHFMTMAKYDVMALGNHEFDIGPKGLRPFLQNVTKKFKVVGCNVDFQNEPLLKELQLSKSTTITKAQRKIGVIGYTTEETPALSETGQAKFTSIVPCIKKEAQRLKETGVDIIIALGHAGFRVDKQIAAEVPEVDLVVGGHTNTFLYNGPSPSIEKPAGPYPFEVKKAQGSGKAYVVQAYTAGKYLGFLNLIFDEKGHIKKIGENSNPIILDSTVTQDTNVLNEIQKWKEPITRSSRKSEKETTKKPVSRTYSRKIGTTLVSLDGDRKTCRQAECNMGNFIADAMVYMNLLKTADSQLTQAPIALVNGGGIRDSIEKGTITVGHIMRVHPFQNTIDVVKINGTTLLHTLEYSVHKRDPEDPPGFFLQVSGLKYTINFNKKPYHRISDVLVRSFNVSQKGTYEPLNLTKHYNVLVPSYLTRGGDGFTHLRDNLIEHYNVEEIDSDILRDYVKHMTVVYTMVEDRITILEEDEKNYNCTSFASSLVVSKLIMFILTIGFLIFVQ